MQRIQIIDSHTGGEPTRVVTSGGPDLGGGDLSERLERLRAQHDGFRSAVVCEPRGSDVLVGALICESVDNTCAAGVIFFNNVGYLGMCGHGTIGLVTTMHHMGLVSAGRHRIETPVGIIDAELHPTGEVSFENVASFRLHKDLKLDVPGIGPVTGDVAWGGNWFFLVNSSCEQVEASNIARLTDLTSRIKHALAANSITGSAGQEIDHIELFGPTTAADSRNFVLCPGGAYDRSPCGTGTSAKLACLIADGKLKEGWVWRQESIIGTVFEGTVALRAGQIIPRIKGRAFVTAEATLILDERDPFSMGIR